MYKHLPDQNIKIHEDPCEEHVTNNQLTFSLHWLCLALSLVTEYAAQIVTRQAAEH